MKKEPLHQLTMVSMKGAKSLIPFTIDDFEIKGITHYELIHVRPGLAELALTLLVYVPAGEDTANDHDNNNRPRRSSAPSEND